MPLSSTKPTIQHFMRVEGGTGRDQDAVMFAARIEADIFYRPIAKELSPFTVGYEDLPQVLRVFAEKIERMLSLTGKPGRKQEVYVNQHLITAPEFVRLKTGSEHDEHLAELLQGIAERGISDDFAGDAIRKKRKYLRKTYPEQYQFTLQRANEMFQRHDSKSGTIPSRSTF